ncbi:hypothetical protein AAEX63_08275 [Luteococcus sp. H138]|uniref:hypothetical protein n=1 Tax=unclassified Luteococcus TaxID=2639923 RepID=UPI00313EFD29
MDSTNQHGTSEQAPAWVATLLGSEPTPTMPPEVLARLDEAIAQEQEIREAGDFPEVSCATELIQLEERTALGSFGPNAPTRYSPDGLGLTPLG